MAKGLSLKHRGAASIAVVGSIILHSVLIYFLGNLKFDVPIATNERLHSRRVDAMQLMEVHRDTTVQEDVSAKAWSEIPGMGHHIALDAKTLAVAPDEVAVAPPVMTEVLAGELGSMGEPSAMPEREGWQPRQEILVIEKKLISDEFLPVKRLVIPVVERVSAASDSVMPAVQEIEAVARVVDPGFSHPVLAPSIIKATDPGSGSLLGAEPELEIIETVTQPEEGPEIFAEPAEEITEMKALERHLKAGLTTHRSMKDRNCRFASTGRLVPLTIRSIAAGMLQRPLDTTLLSPLLQ